MTSKLLGTVSVLLVIEQAASQAWTVGGFGQTCTQVCASSAGCAVGQWPTDLNMMRTVANSAGITCTESDATVPQMFPMSPQFSADTGKCLFPTDAAQVSCDQPPTSGWQRICPCGGGSSGGGSSGSGGSSGGGSSLGTSGTGVDARSPVSGASVGTMATGSWTGASSGVSTATNSVSCQSGANFRIGDSTGGTKTKFTATFISEEVCKLEARRLCPNANGATYSPGVGECWCETGMTGQNIEPTLRTCWFQSGTTGTGTSRLWSLGVLVPEEQNVAMGAAVAMVATVMVGLATSIVALRRTKATQAGQERALVSEEREPEK